MPNAMHNPIFLHILEFIYNNISKLLISLNRFPFDQTTWQEWSKFSHRKFSQSKLWPHMQSRFQSQRILMPTFQASCLSIVFTSYWKVVPSLNTEFPSRTGYIGNLISLSLNLLWLSVLYFIITFSYFWTMMYAHLE